MGFNPEFGDGGHDVLIAQADRISGLVVNLLDNSPVAWSDTKMRHRAPLGPDFRLDVNARSFYRRGETVHERDIEVLHNESAGSMKVAALILDMQHSEKQPVKSRIYMPEVINELLDRDDIPLHAKAFLTEAACLSMDVDNKAQIFEVNRRIDSLLIDSAMYHGRGSRKYETLAGDVITIMANTEYNSDPTNRIDTKPEIQVRVEFDGRAIDMIKDNGVYETVEVDPNSGRRIRALVGEQAVADIGGAMAVFDDGSMAANQAVLDEAERAMGLRDLKPEYLDKIESALRQMAAERL